MSRGLRKLLLSTHLIVSIGWIGALGAYLSLDIATATSNDPGVLRAAYVGMEIVAVRVIVPLAIATLVSGIVIGLATRWGLFRHYWVVISLLLTILATTVLLVEVPTISKLAEIAADPSTMSGELTTLSSTLVHSIGGLVVLVAILVLNVYKPRGVTRYGWRQQNSAARSRLESADSSTTQPRN